MALAKNQTCSQQNKIKDPNMNTFNFSLLQLTEVPETYTGENKTYSTNGAGKIG